MNKAASITQKINAVTRDFPESVLQIDKQIANAPNLAELWFQRGMELSNVRLMRDAIQSFSEAILLEPTCGIYYRWRGHRHLNVAELPEACADLVVASRLIPDNWDVWYHLGLTHVVLGNYALAELAYQKCAEAPTERKSNRICRANWMYLALMHQGKTEAAQAVLRSIPDDETTSDYNNVYLSMINFYKGKYTDEEMLAIPDDLDDEKRNELIFDICTRLFGMANHYYTLGNRSRYQELIDQLLVLGKNIAWNSFGYAAAYYTTTYRDL